MYHLTRIISKQPNFALLPIVAPPPADNPSSSPSIVGPAVGGAIGGFAGLVLIAGLATWFVRHRKSQSKPDSLMGAGAKYADDGKDVPESPGLGGSSASPTASGGITSSGIGGTSSGMRTDPNTGSMNTDSSPSDSNILKGPYLSVSQGKRGKEGEKVDTLETNQP